MGISKKCIIFFRIFLYSFVFTLILSVSPERSLTDTFGVYSDLQVHQLSYVTCEVIIFLKSGELTACEGSVINQLFILTTAQCLKKDGITRVFVLPADYVKISGTNERVVADWYIHEDFKPMVSGDIALIMLERGLRFQPDEFQAVPVSDRPPLPGEKCIVSGWDLPDTLGKLSMHLRDVVVVVKNSTNCQRNNSINFNVDSFICVEYPEGICQEITGGSLVCKGKLTGLFSYGVSCNEWNQNKDIFYTNVFYYLDWIYMAREILQHRSLRAENIKYINKVNSFKSYSLINVIPIAVLLNLI